MKHLKYYIALIMEIVGIIVVCAGLFEMLILEVCNPANFLITGGSAIMAIGSLIFAKIINWGDFVNNCEGCYQHKKKQK